MHMEQVEGPAVEPVSVGEARAFLRIETSEEDASLAGFLRVARELCEAFTGQVMIATRFRETAAASRLAAAGAGLFGGARAMPLSRQPVRSVTNVTAINASGTRTALAQGDFALEEDGRGEGRLVIYAVPPGTVRVEADYWAGMGSDWNAVPEALRQGMLRLAAHLYAYRDRPDDTGPPAAVAALWRPFRKSRLM